MALQLSVLHQNRQVINLENKAVLKYMEEQSFAEVCSVLDRTQKLSVCSCLARYAQ